MPAKVTAPVARSTAYDFNCQLSKCHLKKAGNVGVCAVAHAAFPEVRNVMPHEILFALRTHVNSGDPRLRAMSSVNGVPLGPEILRDVQRVLAAAGCQHYAQFNEPMRANSELAEYLAAPANHRVRCRASDVLTQHFTYMGVAITPCAGGASNALQRQGFSASRGGLMTVMNNGLHPLVAGKRVRMVIDVLDVVRNGRAFDDHLDGIPRQKVLARLVNVDDDLDGEFEDIADGMRTTDMKLHLSEPFALTPALEYMGRERFPWHGEEDRYPGQRPHVATFGTRPASFSGISSQLLDEGDLAADEGLHAQKKTVT
jgi:hypothetical protein